MLQKKGYTLKAVESVLSNSSKIMIDVEGGNNLLYLPLDQLINKNQTRNDEIQQSESEVTIMDRINSNRNNLI
jgi:membrane protease subunit HflK